MTEEYKIIRNEIQSVKDCITKYISFVLGGSGIAAFGLSYLMVGVCENDCDIGNNEFVLISIVVSFLITFITAVILYKAHSHNRYAGYSKAIGNETIGLEKNGLHQNDLYLWEECLTLLRKLYLQFTFHAELVNDPSVSNAISNKELFLKVLKAHAGSMPYVDYRKRTKGCISLLKALTGRIHTNSWGFPPYILAINCVLCALFVVVALVLACYALFSDASEINIIVAILAFIALILQCAIWFNFCGKLNSLMSGINTVDSFFIRFAPIRAKVLSEFGIQSTYVCLVDTLQSLESSIENIRKERQSREKKRPDAVEK